MAISNDSSASNANALPKAQDGSPLAGKVGSPSVLDRFPDDESTLPAEGPDFYKGQMGLAVAISNDSSPSDADASHKGQDDSLLDDQQPNKVGPPSGKVGSPSLLVRSPNKKSTLPAKGTEFYKGRIFPSEETFDAAVEASVARTNKKFGGEKSSAKRVHGPIMSLLSWLNANVQDKDGVELKASAASFMGIEVSDDCEIKLSTKTQTTGATAIKRKNSDVEMATTSSTTQKPCTLCGKGGHNRANCEVSEVVGTQMTRKVYNDIMNHWLFSRR